MKVFVTPATGWDINGVHVCPPEAYMRINYWLEDFEALFPAKAKLMRAYSEKMGWAPAVHILHWPDAVMRWLNRYYSARKSS